MNPFDHALGLRHAALECTNLERSLKFYIETMGMHRYYDTDADWAMLTLGITTLSLVPVKTLQPRGAAGGSHHAHLGFVFDDKAAVDALHTQLKEKGVSPLGHCEAHRDGSYGFYVNDPDGNALECIFIPHLPSSQNVEAEGWVLLAHGSKSAAWAEPFQLILASLQHHVPRALCRLAFMEMSAPTLLEVVDELVMKKVRRVRVFPVFLSGGGAHMTQDIPSQVQAAAQRFPGVEFTLTEAIGATRLVRESIVSAVVQAGVS